MNSLVKQRIVGAVVLVALGVIFIPMFLTGEGDILSDTESNVPPKPTYELEAPKVNSLQPQENTKQAAVATPVDAKPADDKTPVSPLPGHPPDKPLPGVATEVSTTATPEKGAGTSDTADSKIARDTVSGEDIEVIKPGATTKTEVAKTDSKTATDKPVTATADTSKEPATQSTQQAVQVNKSVTQAKAAPAEVKSAPAKPAPIVNGYVVQLGSFSVEKNATQLRDKLRKAGHASFVEKHTKNSKTSYRVRVGPELTRELAEKLKVKLKDQTKINGFIVKYPQ